MRGILLLLSLAALSSASAYDLHTRALTPVVEKARPAGTVLDFVRDGRLSFAIVRDAKAETRARNRTAKSIEPAVNFLAEAFERTTGKRPEIIDESDTNALRRFRHWLVVGDSRLAREAAQIDWRKLPVQGFAIKTFVRGLAIVGYDSSLVEGWNLGPIDRQGASLGTYYGVLDFTERFLGCRYYFPGPYGSLYPVCTNLTVSPVHYEDAPVFATHGDRFWFWATVRNEGLVAKWRKYMGDELKIGDTSFVGDRWRIGSIEPRLGQHSPEPISFAAAYSNEAVAKPHRDRGRGVSPRQEEDEFSSVRRGETPRPQGFATASNELRTIFYTSPSGKLWYNPRGHIGNYYDVTNLKFADLLMDAYRKYYASNGRTSIGKIHEHACASGVSFGVCDTFLPAQELLGNATVRQLGLVDPNEVKNNAEGVMRNVYGRFFQYLGNSFQREFPDRKLWLLVYYNSLYAPTDPRWRLPDNVEINLCLGDLPRKASDPSRTAASVKIARDWYQALGNRPAARLWLYTQRLDPFQRAVIPEYVGKVPALLGKYLGRDGMFMDYEGDDLWHYYYAVYASEKAQWNPAFDVDAALDEHWLPFFGPKAGPHLQTFHRLLKEQYEQVAVPSSAAVPLYPYERICRMETELKAACAATTPESPEGRRVRLVADYWPKAFETQRALAKHEKGVYNVVRRTENFDWQAVPALPLGDILGRSVPKEPVEVKLSWDEHGIYGKFDSKLPPKADPAKDPFHNDAIEFFLSPGLDKAYKHQLVWDAAGHFLSWQQRLHPITQPADSTWKAAGHTFVSKVDANGWHADFFLPFSAFPGGVPRLNDSWHANFVFTNRKGTEIVRGSSMTLGNHHNMDMYGLLRFAGRGEVSGGPAAVRRTYANGCNTYVLETARKLPRGSVRGQLEFMIRNHQSCGFDALVNWLTLEINGISSRDLELQSESSGTLMLNFDGVCARVRPYLKEDSPILWCDITILPGDVPVNSFRVFSGCVPSILAKRDGKPVFNDDSVYARRIVKPASGTFVFLDEHFDGSADDRGNGPCAVFADMSAVASVAESVKPGCWVSSIAFTVRPGVRKMTVGILEYAGVRKSNEKFVGELVK